MVSLDSSSTAESYHVNWVTRGISCGGPGNALQNPDSEQPYAMLESFVKFYESTGNNKWLSMAKETAIQFSSWVMPYGFRFPVNFTLGKPGTGTTDTIVANTHNTHKAPGIWTHSGIALQRLFRATGEEYFMKMLKNIVRAIPLYLSNPPRPTEIEYRLDIRKGEHFRLDRGHRVINVWFNMVGNQHDADVY